MAGPSTQTLRRRLGQRVKSRYRLLEVVGSGGQGAVYRAVDERDGDHVAVKILHTEVAEDPNARERLVREARALMVLAGTAALEVLDQGFTDDGNLALVTELLSGEELDDFLVRHEQGGGRLNVPEALSLFQPIADTLSKAHALGIVHRDLKPANVFLTQDVSASRAPDGLRLRQVRPPAQPHRGWLRGGQPQLPLARGVAQPARHAQHGRLRLRSHDLPCPRWRAALRGRPPHRDLPPLHRSPAPKPARAPPGAPTGRGPLGATWPSPWTPPSGSRTQAPRSRRSKACSRSSPGFECGRVRSEGAGHPGLRDRSRWRSLWHPPGSGTSLRCVCFRGPPKSRCPGRPAPSLQPRGIRSLD
jgi:serine/threonine protein kinase